MSSRRVVAYLSIIALVLAAAPAGAQDFAPDTVWGEAPANVAAQAANAVLTTTGGVNAGTAPVTAGRFQFLKVAPGDYVVTLTDGAGAKLATSHVASLAKSAVVKVHWADERPAAAAVPTQAASHKTTYIVIGAAAAAGVTTAIVVGTHKDNNPPVSGSR